MSRYVKFFAACANFSVTRGAPKWGFARAKTPGTPVRKFNFFAAFAPLGEIFRVLVAAAALGSAQLETPLPVKSRRLEEAVIGGKEQTAKTSGLTLRARVGDIKGSNQAENSPPFDSITPELMSRIEQSRIDGFVIEFS
jgi:hypothetical protein